MRLKDDSCLEQLTMFGFRCVEKTDGLIRYSKRIGNLVVTVANGQFENKIRVSMLKDRFGMIRTTYHDLNKYTDLIGSLVREGLIMEESLHLQKQECEVNDDYCMEENPLLSFPRKPDGFMAM